MFEQLRPALVITVREVRDQLRDWRIIFPVLGLTVFFPYLMNFTATQMLNFVSRYGANIIGERLVPFLLMIVGFFPISVSLVIALETFVGEKERGSIEPLLNSPLENWQLYLGKLLSATVPPLLSSFVGMTVYLVGLTFNHVPLPELSMLILIIVLTIVQAVMMVSAAVVVSTQATSVRAANLLASFIITPSALLIQGESVLMFWGTYQSLWWAVFGLLVLTVLLIRVGLAHFQREELLGREIDVLNLRWGWRVFWSQFIGGARNPWQWFTRTIPHTVKALCLPIILVFILGIAGIWVGTTQVERFYVPLQGLSMSDVRDKMSVVFQLLPTFSFAPVLAIWWQNLRVLLFELVLGVFSFGIVGVIPFFASMASVGYLFGLLSQNDLQVSILLAFIIPHGILEIPAAILATAAVMRAGAILATPTLGKTVGEVWIVSLADWLKVMLGVVAPVLFIAACIEAWVTPNLVLLFV